jgi:hypothetical protein
MHRYTFLALVSLLGSPPSKTYLMTIMKKGWWGIFWNFFHWLFITIIQHHIGISHPAPQSPEDEGERAARPTCMYG